VSDAKDEIVVSVTAQVANVAGNTTSTVLTNNATLTTEGGTVNSNPVPVEVVEPNLTITKAVGAPSTNRDAGDTITYTITVANNGTAEAEHVVVTDNLNTNLAYVVGSATGTGGSPTPTEGGAGQNRTFSWATIPVGSSYSFTFQVTLNNTVTPNQTI